MGVSVLVPYLPDGATRTRNWRWLRRRWEQVFPTWRLVEGAPAGDFGRGRTLQYLAERADPGDVWVIADADIWVHGLGRAVKAARVHPWVVPHRTVWRLDARASEEILRRDPAGPLRPRRSLIRPEYAAWSGGGCLVIEGRRWPGIDTGFPVWGAEDTGFAIAVDRLVGPHLMLDGTLFHLRHEAPLRRLHPRFPENLARLACYRRGAERDDVLRMLLAGRPTPEVEALLEGG